MAGISLYSNKYIKKDPHFRWKKFYIDFDLTNKYKAALSPFINSWSAPVLFYKTPRKTIPKIPGVYIFYVQPDTQLHFSQSFVLYIGYTMNLWDRYYNYIQYKRSEEPNYIERRIMLNVWEKNLYYSYIPLPGFTQQQVEDIEKKLYDALTPPINRIFAHALIKQQVRLNRN